MKYRSALSGLILASTIFFIFTFSLQDAPTSNALSTQVTQTLYEIATPLVESTTYSMPSLNSLMRDFGHFALFFLLGLISMLAFLYQRLTLRQSAWTTLILGTLVALADELLQLTSPGRAFEFVDLGKDLLGISVSIMVIWGCCSIITYLIHPHKTPR